MSQVYFSKWGKWVEVESVELPGRPYYDPVDTYVQVARWPSGDELTEERLEELTDELQASGWLAEHCFEARLD